MPVVGYLLIMSPAFVSWFDPATAPAHKDLSADNVPLLHTHAWRLIFIYCGLTLTGVATALFSFFCPAPVKKYGDALDYSLGVKDLYKNDDRWTSLADTLTDIYGRRGNFPKWVSSEDLQSELTLRIDEINTCSPKVPAQNNGAAECADRYRVAMDARLDLYLLCFWPAACNLLRHLGHSGSHIFAVRHSPACFALDGVTSRKGPLRTLRAAHCYQV